MIKLNIQTGTQKVSFSLGEVTYFYGPNYDLKFDIIQTLRKHFFNVDQSEYDYEKEQTSRIFINDEALNIKKWKYYELTPMFNLETEFKLGSKSLMIQYVESNLVNIEYEEEVSSINILYQTLNELMTEKLNIEDFEVEIEPKLIELSLKTIIKSLELKLLKEEHIASTHNLTYSEIMKFQIFIAKSIAKNNPHKHYIFKVDLPKLNEDIIKSLKDIENAHFIIVNEHDILETPRENVIYFGKEIINFSDDVLLYEKIMLEYGSITTLEDLNIIIKQFLTKEDNEITRILKENL
ncbi:MAG: hypothetical protein GX931_06175 [Acholeplasmataceae bacterium]|nr:hypothetical protein [Acholeplasmataceae bacterium]